MRSVQKRDPRGTLSRRSAAYLVAQVLPDGTVTRVIVASERQPTVLHGEQNVVLAAAQGATYADAERRLVASVTRPGQTPYPTTTPQVPIPRTPTEQPLPLPLPSTTPEEARWKDRAAWTGAGLIGGAVGWLVARSLAAALAGGAIVVGGGLLYRDWSRARMLEGRRG
ncbi:MAG: hypothetical protein QUS11_06550 [Candidatus Fermentibacter sp.]|nr:hypothetical protein [Candidatus Fermentibacter sp.]